MAPAGVGQAARSSIHGLGLAAAGQPDRLGGIEQGGLNFGHEPLLALLILGGMGQHLREGGGMAQVDQQRHLIGREAEQMFITVVGDSHAALVQSTEP